ncbi:MAG: hypothetical protein AAF203_02210, partial [Pseudomonadota bacterium]
WCHYLNKVIDEKKAKNPLISLRGLSKKMDLSVAMLSGVLNGSKHLSVESAFKISKWLGLKGRDSDYFMDLVQLEIIKDPKIVEQLARKMINRYSKPNEERALKVSEVMKKTMIGRQLCYGIPKTHKTRNLSLLIDRETGRQSEHFYDNLYNPEISISITGHFIFHSETGCYQAYLDFLQAETYQIDQFFPQNNHLLVDWDEGGLPSIRSVAIKTREEDSYLLGDMIYNEEKAVIRGEKIFPQDVERTEPVEHTYFRFR